MDKLDRNKKEKIGWMILADKSMNKIWDNNAIKQPVGLEWHV